MTALTVLLAVLLVLFLISRIRIGAKAEYSEDGAMVWVKAGPLSFQVWPAKKEKKEKQERAKKAEPPAEQEKAKPGGSFELLRRMLPLAAEAAGRLRRKVRVDQLRLDFTAAAPDDPAAAALSFGWANSAIGMIWPLLEHNFHIRSHCIRTRVDFQRAAPAVYLYLEASLNVGQAIALAVILFWKFFRIYQTYREEEKSEQTIQKEAV